MTSKMEKHSKANNTKHKNMKGQAIEKSPHTKNHNQNTNVHKHSDNESHDAHSNGEDCVFKDPPRDSRYHRSRFDRQSHRSFSTSSTSITSSSSTSSVSSSSVSTSSPSSWSTTSTSSPSSSSDTDSDSSNPRVEPRHYRSCTDIPKKERYFDECDDTAPLLAKDEHVERNQKQDSVPQHGSSQGKYKMSRDGSVRKAKSMESLARTKEKEPQDEAEQEKRSNEAKKNIVKEKMKFSAFLNEITRQVLSPMRLTSLGVANPRRPRSPVQSKKLENTKMKQTEQQRHLQGSADSTSSGKHSHSSSKHSHSHQRHYSHRSEGSPDRKRSSFKRHHSWHRSSSPSDKHHHYYHHHHQHSNPGNEKDYHNYRHDHGPTYDTRTSRHNTKHHHRHNSDQHQNTSHCDKDCEHDQKSCHSDYRETRRSMSPTHHRHHSEARHDSQGDVPKCKDKDCHSPDSYQEELHFEEHHHSHQPHQPHRHQNEHNHLRKKQHGSNHSQHHYHQYESAHHHGNKDHHESHHHHGDHHQRGNRYSDPHHHGDRHSEGHHHRRLHSEAHNNHRDQYGDQNKDLHGHNRDHNREHHHQHGDQNRDSDHHHGDQNKDSHHHHEDKNREPHHHHGDNDRELHHLHGDRQIEPHNHHHRRNHEKQLHHHHGDHSREPHHRHGDHNRAPHYHHGDHSREPHHRHGDHNREPHHHHVNPDREPHHHGNPDREPHHHHGNPDREPHHHHGNPDREPHHHHGNPDREPHHHHEDHPSQTSHQNLDDHCDSDQVQSQKNLGLITSHHGNPVKSPDTLRPVSSQEEEQTSFSNPLHNETADGMGRIIILQEQNEGLQQSLLKTAVRVECLGEEFMSSRHCLEAELQKTRMELSNLTERFKKLHDNCSSTQQTNSLLEHKLHLVSQNMEGERKRLNMRISALTERLADAKFVNNMDTGKARQHQIQSDVDATDSPVAPPPAQFMDSMNYHNDNEAGQEQSLGSVPEEEESDWSEIGEETPRFVLMGLNRGQAWRYSEGDEDKVSGLGREEIFQAHSSRPSTIPQLQFTVHNDALPLTQTLSDIVTCQSSYKITTNPSLGSAVLVRSASLEEIPLPRSTIPKELRGTEAMMDLHHSGAGTGHDLDNEFIHHLKSSRETALGRDCGVSEMDAAMSNLQSAERILNHLISETQQTEAEVHGWSQAFPDELLKGERTKL